MKRYIKSLGAIVILFGLLTTFIGSRVVAAYSENAQHSRDNIHPIPQVPIVVDGERMPASEITRFNGAPLYSIVDGKAVSEGVLYTYTTIEGLYEHVENYGYVAIARDFSGLITQGASCSLPAPPYFDPSLGYNGISYSGSYWGYVPGVSYSTLQSQFDNNHESFKTTACNQYTKLYDYTNFGGSSLWLACCGNTPDLGVYGWRNRASSINMVP